MKRKILFMAIIILFVMAIFIQNVNAKILEMQWEEAYATEQSHHFYDFANTQDGGYIAVGYNYKSGNSDASIVKYNNNHKVEWEKNYGEEGTEEFTAITPTSDGNFVAVGHSDSAILSFNGIDIIIVKYDIKGNILKEQTISFEKNDYAVDIIETSEENFIVVGKTDSSNPGTNAGLEDGIIIKLDKEFIVESTKTIGKNRMDRINRVVETKDGKIIVTGNIENETTYYHEALLAKLDKNLVEEWQIIEENEAETITSINSIIVTSDGNILTVGDKQDLMTNLPTGIITKRDKDGKIIWHKEIEGTKEEAVFFNDVIELSTGGYIAVGDLSKQLPEGIDAEWMGLIIKYDENGNIVWKKTHGDLSEREALIRVIEAKNSDIVAMGEKNSSSQVNFIDTVFVGYKEYLKTIEVTNVIEPLEGEVPVSTGITIPEGADYEIDTIAWHVSDTEDGYYESMEEDEKFEAGKYYRIQLEFVAKNDYEFSSPIEATINGKEAVAMTTYTEAQAFAILEFGKLEEAKEYNVIEGAKQTYIVGESDSATFKIDAEYSKLLNVKIDGKEIADFTAESGSTIITLSKSYVESLELGEHTLVVTFTDGKAITKFKVAEKETVIEPTPDPDQTQPTDPITPGGSEDVKPEDSTKPSTPSGSGEAKPEETIKPSTPETNKKEDTSIPKTGDNIVLYIILFVVSISGLLVTLLLKKKTSK